MTYNFPKTSKILLDRARLGDTISWNEFYGRNGDVIHRSGVESGLQSTDCDDLVQNVMLALFKQSQTFTYNPAQGMLKSIRRPT